jgi:hypothetical protein
MPGYCHDPKLIAERITTSYPEHIDFFDLTGPCLSSLHAGLLPSLTPEMMLPTNALELLVIKEGFGKISSYSPSRNKIVFSAQPVLICPTKTTRIQKEKP